MTLYHGSDQIIKTPQLRHSDRTLDFGLGFYTTTNKEQAKNFAVKVYNRSIRSGDIPKGKFISIYEVDYETMKRKIDILHFESADEAWFDFVIVN
jgi:tRNA A-37 threonylcarbamoyl transferase component Bud32